MKPNISGISKWILQKSFFAIKNVYDYNPTLFLDTQCNWMVFFLIWEGGSYDQGANI
jgi:hypothetical protein